MIGVCISRIGCIILRLCQSFQHGQFVKRLRFLSKLIPKEGENNELFYCMNMASHIFIFDVNNGIKDSKVV